MHQRPGAMEIVDPDETKLYEVAKHSFGIVRVYLLASLGMILATFLAYYLFPSVISNTDRAIFYATLFSIVSVAMSFIVILVSSIVYRQNRLIVTDRNVTQVLQYSLFNRKVSQLNIVNVEDVTSSQKGILSTVLNFGTLSIETAGEQSNFHFSYCPNSNYCAKVILDAREKMLGQMENDSEDIPATSKARAIRARRVIHNPKSSSVNEKDKTTSSKSRSKEEVRNIGAKVLDKAKNTN